MLQETKQKVLVIKHRNAFIKTKRPKCILCTMTNSRWQKIEKKYLRSILLKNKVKNYQLTCYSRNSNVLNFGGEKKIVFIYVFVDLTSKFILKSSEHIIILLKNVFIFGFGIEKFLIKITKMKNEKTISAKYWWKKLLIKYYNIHSRWLRCFLNEIY